MSNLDKIIRRKWKKKTKNYFYFIFFIQIIVDGGECEPAKPWGIEMMACLHCFPNKLVAVKLFFDQICFVFTQILIGTLLLNDPNLHFRKKIRNIQPQAEISLIQAVEPNKRTRKETLNGRFFFQLSKKK